MSAAAAAGFLLGLAAGFVFCGLRGTAPIEVGTAVAGRSSRAAGRTFTAGGWIEVPSPLYPILVTSRVSQRLDELTVTHGDTVGPGQVLARLYDGDAQARLRLARARAEEAAERMRLSTANYGRSTNLAEGVLSAEELDEQAAAANTAKAASDAAAAALELAQKELSYCTITAPAEPAGLKVLDVFHTPGDRIVTDRNAAVLSLYNPSNLQMRVDVPQANIRFVRPGQAVSIRTEAHPTRDYAGTVARIDPLAELAKNTVTVRIRVENPDRMLFPEMVAHATFLPPEAREKSRPGTLTVPARAIREDSEGSYVYVFEKGRARRRGVTVGQSAGTTATITSGLSSGQRIIVSDLDRLSDGAEVTAE